MAFKPVLFGVFSRKSRRTYKKGTRGLPCYCEAGQNFRPVGVAFFQSKSGPAFLGCSLNIAFAVSWAIEFDVQIILEVSYLTRFLLFSA